MLMMMIRRANQEEEGEVFGAGGMSQEGNEVGLVCDFSQLID